MDDNTIQIDDLFTINEKLLSIGGIWPSKRTYFKYTVFMVYSFCHIAMNLTELYTVLNRLELVITNLTESVLLIITFPMLLVIRFNGLLDRVIDMAKNDIKRNDFTSIEERRIYAQYNYMSKIFFKAGVTFTSITIVLIFFKPMIRFITRRLVYGEEVTDFVLPCRTYIFFNISSTRVYLLVYIYQFPVVYLALCHIISISLLVNLVFHVCGQLSILSQRIRLLRNGKKDDVNEKIRNLVQMHLKIIWMGRAISKSFRFLLLLEIIGNSIRLGLSSYRTITNSNVSNAAVLFLFISYSSAIFVILFGYCFIGEQLIEEVSIISTTENSKNVSNAYYECNWYEMPESAKKLLLICMTRSQMPLQLTAGKFYIFSLENFTGIIKVSMTYLSMLRTVM